MHVLYADTIPEVIQTSKFWLRKHFKNVVSNKVPVKYIGLAMVTSVGLKEAVSDVFSS